MRLSIAYLSLVALALSLGLPAQAQETQTEAPAAEVLPAISVVAAVTRDLQDHVLASGLVAPVETVYVAPLVEGQQIEELLADVGDSVTKGQVLARLSQASLTLQKAQLTASLASAKASIAQAEASLTEAQSSAAETQRVADRTAKLAKAGTASNAANDQAQAALVSAQARVAVATQTLEATRAQLALVEAQMSNVDLQLSRTEVVAPVDGVITARNAQLGAIASGAGQPMFTLIRDGAMELRADVSESDLPRLAKDQPARLTLATDGQVLDGTVRLVEPTIDATSRLGRARIQFADASAVRPGMFVSADILVARRTSLALPVTAVGSFDGQSTVMLVKDGVVHRTLVQTGITDSGWIEILSGLSEGDQVVAKAGAFVADGDRVTPVAAETN